MAAICLTAVSSAYGINYNYDEGGADTSWNTADNWSPNGLPTISDGAWMNMADKAVTLPNGTSAQADHLIVGRHATGVSVTLNGGSLDLAGLLFIGQYGDAEGTVTLNSGQLTIGGEFAVSVSGPGTFVQNGGTATAGARFVIGRYNRPEAVGTATLKGGSLTADRIDINPQSRLVMEGGELRLVGNDVSKVNSLISSGQIVAAAGGDPLAVSYAAGSNRTILTGGATPTPPPPPPANDPTLFGNYSGTGASASWHDASLWSPTGVPSVGDEAWMNTPNTSALVSSDADFRKLIISRHTGPVSVTVDGAHLRGTGNSNILFLGQYENAHGLLTLKSGEISVSGEFAVSVSGRADFLQESGTTTVGGRFVIGRYDRPAAIGTATLEGGTLTADRIDINPQSQLIMSGGELRLIGNEQSKLNSLISAGRILVTNSGDPLDVSYDSGTNLTTLTGGAISSPPPARDPIRFSTYLGTTASDLWTDASFWRPQEVPLFGDEVWMNTADTRCRVLGDANFRQLLVGRHHGPVALTIDGGHLQSDAADPGCVIFLGQYENAHGILHLLSGQITIAGELAVAVSGRGEFLQESGTVQVGGRFVVGRYNRPTAIGTATLKGGTLTADRIDVNAYSQLVLQGGTLRLVGNEQSKLNSLISDGRIVAVGQPALQVTYDSGTNITTLTGGDPDGTVPWQVTTTPDGSIPNWDTGNITALPTTEIGPRLPQIVSDGVRQFTPVPTLGVHPRIFFGPEDLPAMRQNLQNTAFGQEAMTTVRHITTISREGRPVYNTLPQSERYYPDGTKRVDNQGIYDRSSVYAKLAIGDASEIGNYLNDGTGANVLACFMTLEAFECLIDEGQPGIVTRQQRLGTAMATWCQAALDDPDFGPGERQKVGGLHMALAYDLNYNAMTTAQRATVRKAIARMLWTTDLFPGIDTDVYATTSNWVTINSFVPIMIMAIEGETDKGTDGWSTGELQAFFHDIMKAHYKFFTYGYYESGAGYEGSGKNYQYNMMMVAYAKRGYNYFTHPNVHAYCKEFLPAILHPYGYGVTTYDTIGGSGTDPVIGGQRYFGHDVIGAKWGYPNDPAVDFVWRNYVMTDYIDAGGQQQFYLDAKEEKITPRSSYFNNLLPAVIMASDFTGGDWGAQNTVAQGHPTFDGKERGLIITRSGYGEDDLQMHFHCRQDTGGHTYGDRNSFALSGLGRLWVRKPMGYIPETEWASSILINDLGVKVTEKDGRKCRQPGRIAQFTDQPLATFATGDATYAYSNEWSWSNRVPGTNAVPSGWAAVTETWNDFRHPNNQLSESYGDIPFYDYAHWLRPGRLEGMVKRDFQPIDNYYRTAGMVRGNYSYALIADDVCKRVGQTHNYKWIAQVPEDLTLMPTSSYSGNLDPVRDLVLMEPAATGTRRLLVRVLNAEGAQVGGLGYLLDKQSNKLWDNNKTARRLVIERNAERPRFRVLLYPYLEGEPIPSHAASGTTYTIGLPGQSDTAQFQTETRSVGGTSVQMSGMLLQRSGATLADTRNKITPIEVR